MEYHPSTTTGETSRDPVFSQVLYFGVVLFLTLYLMVVFLQAYYYNMQRAEDQFKVVVPEDYTLTEDRKRQNAQLEGYRWMNREQKIVAIPIQEAMRKVAWQIAGEVGSKP